MDVDVTITWHIGTKPTKAGWYLTIDIYKDNAKWKFETPAITYYSGESWCEEYRDQYNSGTLYAIDNQPYAWSDMPSGPGKCPQPNNKNELIEAEKAYHDASAALEKAEKDLHNKEMLYLKLVNQAKR